MKPICHWSHTQTKETGRRAVITQDCEVVWSEWSVGGSRLCVHGKHPAAHGRIGKQMGHRERECVEWHPEIITSNQSSAGSADRLRLMAPDCCLTALNKWGEEKQGNRTTKLQCPFHFSPMGRKMLPLFSFQCAWVFMCLCVCVCLCCCTILCALIYSLCEESGGRESKKKGSSCLMVSLLSVLLSLLYSLAVAMQCNAEINKLLFKGASLSMIKL